MSASRTGPVSVLYGGAHLFGENVGDKLGRIARKSVETYLGDDESLARVFQLEDHSLARDVRAALRRRRTYSSNLSAGCAKTFELMSMRV